MTEEKTAPASAKATTGKEEKIEEKKEEGIKNEEIKEKIEEKKETAEIKKETDKKEVKEEKEKEKEEEIEIPKKFKKLVDEISGMSVLDLAELVKILEKKFGVSAQAPVAMIGPNASVPAGDQETEQKTVFNVELKKVGDKKIEVIKLVRDITEKGLKEAKDLVDAAAESPQMVKLTVSGGFLRAIG